MTIYVVKRGDTLSGIARRYGLTADDLTWANSLEAPDVLSIGQALAIPVERMTYAVQRGDSAWTIAERFGISLSALLAANPSIGTGNRLYPGQTLIIPLRQAQSRSVTVNGYITALRPTALGMTLPYLSFLAPFSTQTDAYGELTPVQPNVSGLSGEYGVGNLLTVTNLRPQGGFSSAVAHSILTDQNAQDNFVENVLDTLDAGDWYGVNLDFEYVYQFDRDSYSQFVRRLSRQLHEKGYILVTALAPKISDSQSGLLYTAHDYAVHGEAADYVVLMTYEWGYTYGPAMAVSPLNMVRRVLDYAVTEIPPGKILMGVPNYGYDWTLPFVQGTAASPLTLAGAVTLAGTVGATIQYDETAQSPWFNYVDSQGRRHEVWFEDPRSLLAKYELVQEYNLAGVSFWNLNVFYRPNFLMLESLYSVEKPLR